VKSLHFTHHNTGIIINPFEIRAELIAQSADFLKRQHEINTEFAKKTFDQLVTQGQKVQADYKEYMPKMYSFEDVIAQAEKLYGFVKNAK
jgi:hypothetical protein